MATIKILKQVAWRVEATPGTYVEPNVICPYTTFTLTDSYEMIPDESIVGQAFPDLPMQGVRLVGGTIAGEFDVRAVLPLVSAAFGASAAGVYTLPTTRNESSLSIFARDGVNGYRFAGVYISSFELSSSAQGPVTYSAECVGWMAVDRSSAYTFPAGVTMQGVRLNHIHAGGASGYVRLGDLSAALAAGHNILVTDIKVENSWKFGNRFSNQKGTERPISGSEGRPEAKLSLTVSVHESDIYQQWYEGAVPLQAAIRWFSSATALMTVECPNMRITSLTISDDAVPKVGLELVCARNYGPPYVNPHMAFISPQRITITSS